MPEFVVVEAGGRRWALPFARVREVALLVQLTPLPTAPPLVLGLTQLRGQILPVLDLVFTVIAGTPPPAASSRPPVSGDPLLIVELGPVLAALSVDQVLGVFQDEQGAAPLDVGTLFDELRKRVQP